MRSTTDPFHESDPVVPPRRASAVTTKDRSDHKSLDSYRNESPFPVRASIQLMNGQCIKPQSPHKPLGDSSLVESGVRRSPPFDFPGFHHRYSRDKVEAGKSVRSGRHRKTAPIVGHCSRRRRSPGNGGRHWTAAAGGGRCQAARAHLAARSPVSSVHRAAGSRPPASLRAVTDVISR